MEISNKGIPKRLTCCVRKNKEITIRLLVLFGLVGFVVIFCIFSVIWLFAGTLKNLTKPCKLRNINLQSGKQCSHVSRRSGL